MKRTCIVLALAAALLAGCGGRNDTPEAQRRTAAAPARTAVERLPGTEALQRLLPSVGTAATTSAGTADALGQIFGNGGVLGGGTSLGMGVTGAPAAPGAAHGRSVGDPAVGIDVDDAGATDDLGALDPGVAASAPPPPAVSPPARAGGGCAVLGQRIAALARAMVDAQLHGVDAETREMTEAMIAGPLAALPSMTERACTDQRWPRELVDCLLTGADLDALRACERFATPAMQAQAAPPRAPRPSLPPPVWDGAASDCGAVGAHAAALLEWELSAAPADVRASGLAMLESMRDGVAAACSAGGWPEAQRGCVLRASSVDALNACAGP